MKHYKTAGRLGNQLFQFARAYTEAKMRGENELYISQMPFEIKNNDIPIHLCSDGVFEGYFESEQYFDNDLIYNLYKPSEETMDMLREKYKPTTNSCFISIRRGDFYDLRDKYVCLTAEYYISTLNKIVTEGNFVDKIFITTDNFEWVRNNLYSIINDYNCVLLDDETLINTIYTASLCNYNITSSSTFGWWCAWIAEKYNKSAVYCPSNHYVNGFLAEDDKIYFPNRWKKQNINGLTEK